ncbi:imidazole glycerol phosphate synthase subunit HisH [Candidatus Vidania fulgoroideorum]
MIVGIIDIKIGNVYSLYSCVKRIYKKCIIVNKKDLISKCDKIIFPGQGNHINLKKNYVNTEFMIELKKNINKKYFLGICLGSQMFFCNNNESKSNGLCIFNGDILKFLNNFKNFKNPYIGWNRVIIKKRSRILNGIKNNSLFYFSNSYFSKINNNTFCYSINGSKFGSLYIKNNIFLTQFHPEKSHINGLKLIKNFIKL